LFFTTIVPSHDDIGKPLDGRKDNTLRWLCCYKTVGDQKVPYLQGGLIFKEHTHDRTWFKLYRCSHATWFIIKGYENQVVQHFTKDFNQGKDNTTLIYDDDYPKRSILAKIPEEYCALTQLLTENNITIYEICENYSHL
jgi:hypothetical protein